MLTKEENELITQVGPGTPGGNFLRRYWQPVAAVQELTAEKPKLRIKVMDEELVLFRSAEGTGDRGQGIGDGQGRSLAPDPRSQAPVRYGLVGEHCSHRGASLYYGFLEGSCIRCPYHGWMYDVSGKCVEQPFEPQQSLMKYTISHPAYPVEELGGLLFTYMGPTEKKPQLPRWDLLVRQDGKRKVQIRPELRCNWLQAGENTADVTHLHFLHMGIGKQKGIISADAPTARPWKAYGFQPFEWGVLKSWRFEGDSQDNAWGRLLVFPNILRWGVSIHWRVPIDDSHTKIFNLDLVPTPDGRLAEGPDEVPVSYEPSWLNEEGEYHLKTFSSQDGMAWETQGPIFDRTKEHLGASDVGVAMFRQMLMDQIRLVQDGRDPMALAWEPHDMIDLHQWMPEKWVGETGAQAAYLPRDQVFDERYQTFELPIAVAL